MSRRRSLPVGLGLAIALSASAFAPFTPDAVTAGNQLFAEGKFDEATAKYGEALVDDPDSALLNFNMGAAHYKAGRYQDAIASYSRVNAAGDAKREARVAYNIANAHFQTAAASEADDPKAALESYAQALIAYRRSVGADPSAADAKHNYELANKKLLDLKKRMEEEAKKQAEEKPEDQQEQGEPESDSPDDESSEENQDPPPGEQDQKGGKGEEPNQSPAEPPPTRPAKPGDSDETSEENSNDPSPDSDAKEGSEPGDAPPGEPPHGDGSPASAAAAQPSEQSPERKQAAAVIDLAADEELRPDEFVRQMQGAAVAEPSQDW